MPGTASADHDVRAFGAQHGKTIPLWIVLAGLLWLNACGGGSGTSTPLPVQPQAQSISFSQLGPLYMFLGDAAFSNLASGGGGSGAITYSTDTPAVATVNSTSGLVTINASGVAKITATKAADSAFLSAQATYELQVAPRSVNVTAWIGPSDTQVDLAPLPLTLDIAHATYLDCDPGNVLTCSDVTQTPTTAAPLVDSTTSQSETSMYWLLHGPNVTAGITVPEHRFRYTKVADSVGVNGKLWVLTSDGQQVDMWSSEDGANWVEEASNVLGGSQTDVHLLYNGNAFWIIAGSPNGNLIWSSADGKSWTQVAIATAFPGRTLFAAASFNGRLWVYGGAHANLVDQNDLWSSTDGITWVENSAAVLPQGREQLGMVAFNGQLWIIGGWHNGGVYGDVWSSSDGATWTQVTASAAFGPRYAERVVTDGTQLWLFGGANDVESSQADVWSSPDGVNWSLVATPVATPIANSPGFNFDAAWWNGAFWIMSGLTSEVWSSPTGARWTKVTLNARIPDSMALAVAGYQGQVWAVGTQMELFFSSDGLNWTTATETLPGPYGSPILVGLPDRLILITWWLYSAPNYNREVWQSTDGTSWTQISATVPFSSTASLQTAYYNGRLWVFSTNITDGVTPEIWSTVDGLNWTLAASNPAWAPRASYQVIVDNGQMYVIAGSDATGPLNDVWSSTDGATWKALAASTGLPAQNFNTAVSLASSMCVIGSVAPYPAQGVWCSGDGISWSNVTNLAPDGPVAQVGGDIFVIGNGVDWSDQQDLVWKSSDAAVWRLGYQNTFQFR